MNLPYFPQDRVAQKLLPIYIFKTMTTAPRRKPLRLPNYNYSLPGAYFITLVTHQRECLFGRIDNNIMSLNPNGEILAAAWNSLPDKFADILTETSGVMPNHFHGILSIRPNTEPLPEVSARRRMLIPMVIGYLKMNTAKQINLLRNTVGFPVWQRSYFEHIITSEHELDRLHDYIVENPRNWVDNEENLENLSDIKSFTH